MFLLKIFKAHTYLICNRIAAVTEKKAFVHSMSIRARSTRDNADLNLL